MENIQTRNYIAPFNANEVVTISNPDILRNKLQLIKQQDLSNIQVIADFDRTISRWAVDGVHSHSTYGILERYAVGADREHIIQELFEYYHAIEVSPEYSLEDKLKYMQEWWARGNELIISSRLKNDSLEVILHESPLYMRNAVDTAFRKCNELRLPLTVVSGGIGNFIEILLKKYQIEAHIISNFLQFDEQGICHQFSMPAINTFTKSSAVQEINRRPYIILFGDVTADTRIVEKLPHEVCLNIGFFNCEDYDINDYSSHFDVLLHNDGNFTILEVILDWLQGVPINFEDYPTLRPLQEFLNQHQSNLNRHWVHYLQNFVHCIRFRYENFTTWQFRS